MAYKAIKKEVFRDKYFTQIVYEYRGCTYEVEYTNGINVCCTPAHIQHKDAQEKIDEMLDNPKPIAEQEPIEQQMSEIWDMMGWND